MKCNRQDVTPGMLQKLLFYNPDSGVLFWRQRPASYFLTQRGYSIWAAKFSGRPALMSISTDGYRRGTILHHQWTAHRVAWALYYGKWPEDEIDHINWDKTDNRIANLRPATHSQNMKNMPMLRANKTGVKGVSWHKNNRKWIAQISHDGKKINIGYFTTINAAAEAYAQESLRLHGAFGNTG